MAEDVYSCSCYFSKTNLSGIGVIVLIDFHIGVYYSLSCEPCLGECQILNNMVTRQPVTVRDSIKYVAIGQDRNLNKDEVITSWIKVSLKFISLFAVLAVMMPRCMFMS